MESDSPKPSLDTDGSPVGEPQGPETRPMYLPHPDLTKVHLTQLHREAEAQRLAAQARQPRTARPMIDVARRWTPIALRRIRLVTPL